MKKTISINIGGVIFHIEEDAYGRLKSYLDSIIKYFSTYEDSREIIEDIESRIAEIFFEKIESKEKEALNAEDVDALISTMGNVKDFESFEESLESDEEDEKIEEDKSTSGMNNLYRDTKRKLLGGVLSGLANHFKVDPFWFRLVFLCFFFGLVFLPQISAGMFISYLVLWVVLPANKDMEESVSKKIFRDPDNKMLAGICSGLSQYFGTPLYFFRLLFVISLVFYGSGIILYFCLLFIIPVAKTLSDKAQMKGKPVNLDSMEEMIKDKFNKENIDETTKGVFDSIISFVKRVFETLFILLEPKTIERAVRVLVGVVLLSVGGSLIFTTLSSLTLLSDHLSVLTRHVFAFKIGVWDIEHLIPHNNPVLLITEVFFILIPSVFIFVQGLSLVYGKKILNSMVRWTFLGLWLCSIAGLVYYLPSEIKRFEYSAKVKEEAKYYSVNSQMLYLNLNDIGEDRSTEVPLEIFSSKTNQVRIVGVIKAKGDTYENAKNNTKAIDFNYQVQDSIYYFDSKYLLKNPEKFAFQGMKLRMEIPKLVPFKIDPYLYTQVQKSIRKKGIRHIDLDEQEWMFDSRGNLLVINQTSSSDYKEESDDFESNIERTIETEIERAIKKSFETGHEERTKKIAFTNFNSLKFGQSLDLKVIVGDDFSVYSEADTDVYNYLEFDSEDDELSIRRIRSYGELTSEEADITITVPRLEMIELEGASTIRLKNLNQYKLKLDLSGASKAIVQGEIKKIEALLNGASELSLEGYGRKIDVELNGASDLKAIDFVVEKAEIDINGASDIRIYATEEIEGKIGGSSTLQYKGQAKLSVDSSQGSDIEKL